jgi:hypothetical protein
MSSHRFAFAFLSALAAGFGPAPLDARTLTAADGRKIEAEVVGFEGTEKVTIKRADTGQTFTLPISTFSTEDQGALLAEAAEAAKNPPPLPPNAITVELSRAKFDSRRKKQDVSLENGDVRKDGVTITEEDWGFSVTLRNTTAKPIEGLRGEYILFVKMDRPGEKLPGDGRLKRVLKRLDFDPVPVGGRVTSRTEAITARKTELAPGIVWSGTDDSKTRDTLHGIWLRIYRGDTLVHESASPGTLATEEKWGGGNKR